MPGFGGSPGLSILSGVAQGVTAERQRRKEAQQQAIIDRLRQAQVQATDQSVALAAAREQRSTADARIEAESAARELADREAAIDEVMAEVLGENPDMTRADARRRARARLDSDYLRHADDRRDADQDTATTERIRAQTATEPVRREQIRASADASRASAESARVLAETRRTDRGKPQADELTLIRAEAEADAEGAVETALERVSPANRGNPAIRRLAIDTALRKAREFAATLEQDAGPGDLAYTHALVARLERIAAEERRGNRRRRETDDGPPPRSVYDEDQQ